MPSRNQTLDSLEPAILSGIESFFWRCEKDLNGALRVAVLLRLEGSIRPDLLTAALQQLQFRHPKLRATIGRGGDGHLRCEFKPAAPPIPLKITDCGEGETPWRQEIGRLLQTEFPADGPLAAVTLLRCASTGRSELLLTVAHAIADGLSAIMLLDDLLTAYASAEADIDSPPPCALPVVTALRARESGGWRGRLRLIRRFTQIKRHERRSSVTSLPEARGIEPYSQWAHWVFSREDTLALIRRCRQEQISLNGALMAATCCGLMDCLPVPEGLFKWQHPFNIRETVEASPGSVTVADLGCFMSNMNGLLQLKQQPGFWDTARLADRDVQAFLQIGGPSSVYNMATAFDKLGIAVSRLLRRPSPPPAIPRDRETLLASNYGVLKMRDTYGSLRPQECTLTFNNEVAGPVLATQALVLGQRLNIGFAADDLDPKFWDRLQVAVRNRLEAAIEARAPESGQRESPAIADPNAAIPCSMSAGQQQ